MEGFANGSIWSSGLGPRGPGLSSGRPKSGMAVCCSVILGIILYLHVCISRGGFVLLSCALYWWQSCTNFIFFHASFYQLQWDSEKTHYYQCHVAPDGSCTFKVDSFLLVIYPFMFAFSMSHMFFVLQRFDSRDTLEVIQEICYHISVVWQVIDSDLITLVLINTLCSQGPLLENTGTHLHKVLGDENVLTVKFADVQKNSSTYCSNRYSKYKEIAKKGIMVGLRRYQFFGGLFSFFVLIKYHSCHWLTIIHVTYCCFGFRTGYWSLF